MNSRILDQDIQEYIRQNMDADIDRILFSKDVFNGVTQREIAEQIDGRKRCQKKLPLWFNTPGIYYPAKLSVEQSSSEKTGRFKAGLAKGRTVLDMTGGLGVDSFFFQQNGFEVTHCEIDEKLSEIAEYNAAVLGANITFYPSNGVELLHTGQVFDTIYIDPSRRIKTQKVFKLQDCEPNIPEILPLLKKSASRIIIKTSPLLDLQAGIRELGVVDEILIISVKNDCKELLWIIDTDSEVTDPEISCQIFHDDADKQYRFRLSEERTWSINTYSNPLSFIYEPDVSLMKAGCFKLICRNFDVLKLHINSHLYTSDALVSEFPGKSFRVHQLWNYKAFSKSNAIRKANIISRNFPLSPEEIKKKHKISDGGDEFLIFTTGSSGQLVAIHCERA